MMEDIITITTYIINRLKEADFMILKQDSVTSKSIYLILDFGVCNSIRISDHKAMKKYKYNVIQGLKGIQYYNKTNGTHRYFYGFEDVDVMIKKLILIRKAKISRLGLLGYAQLLDKCLQEGKWLSRREDNWQLI